MKILKRILATTDLSAPARHAIERAFCVAAETGADLTLTHVLNQNALETLHRFLGPQAPAAERHIFDEARGYLDQLATDLGQVHGILAATTLAAGTALQKILDQADAMDADLLVLGARGEDYLRPMMLGTTAEKLLRRTSRPVLAVKQKPHKPYRRVLVPVDFSPWSASALRLAGAVAPSSELLLLHAFEVPFESKLQFSGIEASIIERYRNIARQEAAERLEKLAATSRPYSEKLSISVHHGDASRVILTQEQEQDCDLIVMGKHGHGVLEDLLLGSTTKHVLSRSSCDVLIANQIWTPRD